MAVTEQQLSELYVATFNRAPDALGFDYWMNSGWTIEEIAESFFDQDETQALYPEGSSDTAFVVSIYQNLFNRTPDTDGLAFWVDALENDLVTRSNTILAVTNGASGTDAAIVANKADVGLYAVENGLLEEDTYNLSGVTDDDATVTAATNDLNVILDITSSFVLTEGQDIIEGTDGNDIFIARGNSSLDNADMIDGKDGIDTVEVMLDNDETAESPLLTNMEILKVQAMQWVDGDGQNDVDTARYAANIDAGDMESVYEYWSEDSRADVTIEDVSHDSNITTVGMRETDPGNEVDLHVFFDPENITSGVDDNGDSVLDLDLVNVYNLQEFGSDRALEGFESVTFMIDDVSIVTELVEEGVQVINTYDELVEAIKVAAFEQGGFNIDVEAMTEETAFFPIDVNGYDKGEETTNTYTPIRITANPNDIEVQTGQTFQYDNDYEATYSAYATSAVIVQEDDVPALTSVNVILDRVGRYDAGGDLLIGSDSLYDDGIQQFDIQVDRGSHLDVVSSTGWMTASNGFLEVINVENIYDNNDANTDGDNDSTTDAATDHGYLIIDEINDVRVFDASAMEGDVTLGAELTSGIVSKYLDLEDDNDTVHGLDNSDGYDASEDNSETDWANVVDREFSYDFGAGDDTLELNFSSEYINDAEAGNTSREDFVLEINGGDGDDTLWTGMSSDLSSLSDDDNWYANSSQNNSQYDSLTINGDAGDDTITTWGVGNWYIDGGADSDTIYTDNSGGMAQYVFNAVADEKGTVDIDDLDSQDAASVSAVNATLSVTFKGFESADIEIANSFDARVNVAISDLSVNQAIKTAINDNSVLNKLLVATDGPANTLIVTSLIDGEQVNEDLLVEFDSVALTTGQAALATPVTLFDPDAAASVALVDGYTDGQVMDYAGLDSDAKSDNVINGGDADNADDVIVLGTYADYASDSDDAIDFIDGSNDTVEFTGFETVVPVGAHQPTNYIVNFDTAWGTTTINDDSADTSEVVTVTFSDAEANVAASTIIFDGVTVTLDAAISQGVIPAVDVAYQFVTAYNASGTGTNNAVWTEDTGEVTFTKIATGDQTDVVAGDFTGTATTTVTVDSVVDGAVGYIPGAHEAFTVDYAGSAADLAGTISFDGTDIAYAVGDGSITLADAVGNATYANWTAVDNGDGTVSFTAVAEGDFDDTTLPLGDYATQLGDTADNLSVASSANTDGTDDVGTSVTTTVFDELAADYLDFTDYNVEAVYVDGLLLAGSAPAAEGDLYVEMTEQANDGEYLIEVWDSVDGVYGGDDDTMDGDDLGLVGVADFGVEQAFIAENFII